ncbi:hypothetical protein [Dactylosporangium sp. NPDC051541]|uniref:hypothetical protein n=1 Tax=Dactylosporangium sp. NPDC051541 TaxID=3363977 RepID=UPI0037922BE2
MPSGSSPGRTAVIVACVAAVVVSAVALLVAWRALDQANDAREIALAAGRPAGAQTVVPQSATGTPEAGATTAVTEAAPAQSLPGTYATGEPPPLDQRTVFKVKYTKHTLTLKTSTYSTMYADLDEPRANVSSNGYDIALEGGTSSQPLKLKLGDDVTGSEAGAPAMTPQDCGEKIRTAPIGDATVPARQGAVLCITTSYAAARSRGDFQRLVLLEITGVTNDNAVTVELSAWDIPR